MHFCFKELLSLQKNNQLKLYQILSIFLHSIIETYSIYFRLFKTSYIHELLHVSTRRSSGVWLM